jgi:hypothetical protein
MLTCWNLVITPVVKVRNEDYTGSHLSKSVYYMNTNEPLILFVLAALAGAGGGPWWSNVQQGLPSAIEERGGAAGCCLTMVYIQKYTSKYVFIKYNYSFHHPQFSSYITCSLRFKFHHF